MRGIVYLAFIACLVVFFIWAYKAMIDIRPRVKRPMMDSDGMQIIDALEPALMAHIVSFADEIGPRNVFEPVKLSAAAEHIRVFWEKAGYEVVTQTFSVQDVPCQNLVVEIAGQTKPDEIVVVGAHYDTVSWAPGANDNGSAVAALLELSRLFSTQTVDRTVRFVAFTNEEPPFFKTRQMGSLVYARACREKEENIVAMVCLETIGYYRDERKTQKYPVPFRFFYPDKGNFLAVVGNLSSKPLVKTFTRHFMEESDFPIECVATFGFITGIDWSDQWSFWQCGYPAIMLTDTALFRYPYYHTSEDTSDKINNRQLAKATYGIFKALQVISKIDLRPGDSVGKP